MFRVAQVVPAKKKRTVTTIQTRISHINGFKQSSLSQRSFGKENGLKLSTFRNWINKEKKYSETSNQKRLRIESNEELRPFINLESQLMEWIREQNDSGIPIKSKHMKAFMNFLRDEKLKELEEGDQEYQNLKNFKVSNGWLQRFVSRFNIVRRTRAKSHKIPDNYQSIARNFVAEVQNIIQEHNIRRENIYNFDQVPRYFDAETHHTYTTKGSKDVQVRESCHKRFTFTPVISATGEFVLKHVLFSKLVKVPRINDGCIGDINKTGMWSLEILRNFIDRELIPRIRSRNDEPCLLIFDSYSVHLKFVKESLSQYTDEKIFFKVIPPGMTPILQPLDVAVNRSFQQHFNDSYIEYLREAISNPAMQTKQGNVKTPNYVQVTNWILRWTQSKSPEDIANAFDVCGLVPRNEFKITVLHEKLKDAFK